jgi:hypothetical protein
MDHVLEQALRLIYRADSHRRESGHETEPFLLTYTAPHERVIQHPGWDPSWGAPSEHTIDELVDLGLLRANPVVPAGSKVRSFAITPAGHREGQLAEERRSMPIALGGWSPPLPTVLAWVMSMFDRAPECFEPPSGLLDKAIEDEFIMPTGRGVLAKRILALVRDGFLDGDLLDSDQATDEQILSWTPSLTPTMKAYRPTDSTGSGVTIFGNVTGSVIAGRDISLDMFVALLDRADAEIAARDDVPQETKREAHEFIARWRERLATASGSVTIAAGGGLAADVLAQLLRLHS